MTAASVSPPPSSPTTAPPQKAPGVETPEIERQKKKNMERNKQVLQNAMAARFVTSNIEDFSKEGVEKKIATLDTARLTAHMRNLLQEGKLRTITANAVLFTLSTPDTFARYKTDLIEPFKTGVMKQLKSLLENLVKSTPSLSAIKVELDARSAAARSAPPAAQPRRSNRAPAEGGSSTNPSRKVRKVQPDHVTVTGSTMDQLVPEIRKLVVARAKEAGTPLECARYLNTNTKSLVNAIAGKCKGQKWEDITYGQDFGFRYGDPGNVWRGQIGRSVHVVAMPTWNLENYYCTVVAHDSGTNLSIGIPAVYLDFAPFHAEFDAHPFNSTVVTSFKPRRVLNVHACEKGLLWNTATGEAYDMKNLPKLLNDPDTVPEFLRNVEFYNAADKVASDDA